MATQKLEAGLDCHKLVYIKTIHKVINPGSWEKDRTEHLGTPGILIFHTGIDCIFSYLVRFHGHCHWFRHDEVEILTDMNPTEGQDHD